jgi:hypothetical protein
MATIELVQDLVAEGAGLAVLATTRADHSIHASLVSAGVVDDPVTGDPAVGAVVRGDARKLALLRASGRAAATFHAGYRWASVEGPVRLVGPADPVEGLAADGLPALLRAVFTAAGGQHEDWAEFDRVMADERRTAVLIQPARILTNG